MKTLLVLLASMLVAGVAQAQVTCTQIGQFLSCDGPRGQNSTQLDLGNGMGVISGQSGYGAPSYMEPYAVIPPPSSPSTVPAPRAPQPPRAPSFPSGGTSDLIQPVEPISPIIAPFSLGGDAGQ
jgi:hypothetical protein